MYLKSLEIAGFKSFAKKATLEFSSAISSIVGPNGSGKSNVAEAFRFVLGEQSIKSMRGKRGEDLIFNGSGDLGRLNRASVKVVFDNSRRALNIDFDEVTLERVVHRDSSNEYLINGSQVRLRDIIELLSGAHIGASGHHIISQGEADKILNANIKERREIIEDALGLKIYQYKKQESQRKLEKTEENIKSTESLRKEIAPHLKFLKKQVEKIEKTFELKENLRGLYREYFVREDAYLNYVREQLATEKRAPTDRLHVLERELDAAKRILAESKTADATSRDLIALETDMEATRHAKDEVYRNSGRIDGEVSSIERLIAKERERQASADQKTVYLRDVESLVKKIDIEVERASSLDILADIKATLRGITELAFSFITQHKDAQTSTSIVDGERDIAKLRVERTALAEKLQTLITHEKELQSRYTALKLAIEREKDSNRDAEKNVFRIMAEQNELHGILKALVVREDKLALEAASFKRELDDAHVIAGRTAVDYKTTVIEGVANIAEVMQHEPRAAQEDRRKHIEKIKIRIEDSGTGNSDEVLREHKEVEERDVFLARELEDLIKSAEGLRQLILELDIRLDKEFKEGILKINAQFQEFFALMFGGGTAALTVMREKKRRRKDTDVTSLLEPDAPAPDSDDDTEGPEGLDITVSLPRKKIKGLEMLSGGERALTSIALLFAVSQVNPPPFIILDETDAALDEANSRKYGDMIENLSKYSQLILITHNRETMSRAGVLYGVTMGGDGGSRLLSIAFEDAVKVAK